jgi:hypothetical protein
MGVKPKFLSVRSATSLRSPRADQPTRVMSSSRRYNLPRQDLRDARECSEAEAYDARDPRSGSIGPLTSHKRWQPCGECYSLEMEARSGCRSLATMGPKSLVARGRSGREAAAAVVAATLHVTRVPLVAAAGGGRGRAHALRGSVVLGHPAIADPDACCLVGRRSSPPDHRICAATRRSWAVNVGNEGGASLAEGAVVMCALERIVGDDGRLVQSIRPRRDRRRRRLVASKSQGGRVIDEAPRPGSRAKTVAFT